MSRGNFKKMIIVKTKFRTIAISSLMSISSAVFSADIPEELLQLDLNRCKADCVPAFGEAVCAQLCGCSVREFKKRMNFEQYLDLSAGLASTSLKPEQRTLLDDIAKICDAEVKIPKKKTGPVQEDSDSTVQ